MVRCPVVLPCRKGSARLLTIACAATACVPSATLAGAEGALRATANLGYDTNATRDFQQTGTVPDLVGSVQADGQAQVANSWGTASAEYSIGAKAFATLPWEDTLVQSARAQAGALPAAWIELGLDGRGKDRHGGDRSYTDGAAAAFAILTPAPEWEGTLRAGAHRFEYWPAFQYSYAAPTISASVRFKIDRRHSATVFGDGEVRTFNGLAGSAPDSSVRHDNTFGLGASYRYRGPFTLGIVYSYSSQRSNSVGQSVLRHRVTAETAVRLPWHLLLLGEGALQWVRYPDGIALSPTLLLLEDNENTNSLSLRLVRPLDNHWDVEANYGIYYSHLPGSSLTYVRQLATVGLAFQL